MIGYSLYNLGCLHFVACRLCYSQRLAPEGRLSFFLFYSMRIPVPWKKKRRAGSTNEKKEERIRD